MVERSLMHMFVSAMLVVLSTDFNFGTDGTDRNTPWLVGKFFEF